MQDVFCKLVGAHGRKGGSKVQEDDFVDPCGLEMRKLFLRSGEKAKIDMRRENLDRMRIEG